MTKYCGIDPGLTGAIAFIDTEKMTLIVLDMPTMKISTGDSNRTVMVPDRLAEIVHEQSPEASLVEKVHSTPNDGHVGAFTFGKATGIIYGVFAGLDLTLSEVSPGKWKKDMRVPADKEAAVAVASRLFPNCRGFWNLKKHHGRAEAALIALYHAINNGFTPSLPFNPGV